MKIGKRKILRVTRSGSMPDRTTFAVAQESAFLSEEELHQAIAEHPEVLPSADLGLGPLVSVGSRLTVENLEIDLVAVDPRGRVAIIEFKKGAETPDVRKVIAQVLDYGSLLWRQSYDDFENRCKGSMGFAGTLSEFVQEKLSSLNFESFDATSFEEGVTSSLESGSFVLMYVARDLDERTRRIMTYLGESHHMAFFAIEVDCFREDGTISATMVPRAAFVPSWVISNETKERTRMLSEQTPEVQKLVDEMDKFAKAQGLLVRDVKTGRAYRVPPNLGAVGFYWGSGKGAEFNFDCFQKAGETQVADSLRRAFSEFAGRRICAAYWPTLSLEELAERPEEAFRVVIGPYVVAAKRVLTEQGESPKK